MNQFSTRRQYFRSAFALTERLRTIGRLTIPFLTLLACIGGSADGRPGDLDRRFGSNGIVSTTLVTATDHTRRLRVQPDGKILVLSTTARNPVINVPTTGTVHRFFPDGNFDTTFAQSGSLSLGGLRDFEIHPDGRILTVATNFSSHAYGRVCRWTSNGNADPTFGTNGCTNITTGSRFEARRIKLQSDGRIVVVAATGSATSLFARLLPDGALDHSFGNSGMASASGDDFSYYLFPSWVIDKTGDIVIQPDGKILFGYGREWDNFFYIGRLDPDGSIDTSFGKAGVASIGIPVPSYAYDAFSFGISSQANGSIFVTGTALEWWGGDSYLTVAKLKNDGSYDPTFGYGGAISLVSSETRGPASAMIVLPTGKILLGGMDDQAFSLLRLNANGSFDTSFGTNGIIQTPFDTSDMTSILAMELQKDGTLIAAGSTAGADYYARLGLTKYLNIASNTDYDFDGDHRADISIFRGSDNSWYVSRSTEGLSITQFGHSTDMITPADITGDGKADIAFFRPSTGEWFVLRSEDGSFFAFPFGGAGDIPAPADYDGDGITDAAVFRPSTGTWFILRSSDQGVSIVSFGSATDRPVPADFDGDGKADIAIYRPLGETGGGEWWYIRSSDGTARAFAFGQPTDKALPADYTGDGVADVAFFRPSTGEWYVLRSEDNSYFAFPFGNAADSPVPGDYDGDGQTDPAVFRPSTGIWFILRSTEGLQIVNFGSPGDMAVPNAYVR
ncbi:MAG TPA: FG-GAP-like repeat-containing protein [Pyrinomonadaceae bacterium]|nr:FG-GAP-like repeat-containing protein [Pyrinomonadaceae bacterium]